jgi:hypothetical protein
MLCQSCYAVIARSEATKQTSTSPPTYLKRREGSGLLRRFAPRNDEHVVLSLARQELSFITNVQ